MDNDIKIAQVLGMIPNITPEQLTELGANSALATDVRDAYDTHGFEADRRIALISLDQPFPVLEMVHQTILGILSGTDVLTETWRTVFGEFKDMPEADAPLLSLDGETGVITNPDTGEVVGQAPTAQENLVSQEIVEVSHAFSETVEETPTEEEVPETAPELPEASVVTPETVEEDAI